MWPQTFRRDSERQQAAMASSTALRPPDRSTRSLAAHRMVHLAAAHDLGDAAVRGIQQLYFAEGIGIDDPERLEILVAGLGIDLDESSSVAHGDAYADAVLEDQARAAALGVATVPFFLFGERYALSGVRSQRWLLEALKHSWALWYS
jgi:predicted DsbA family dithiol-disulfide isomerase